MMRGILKMVWLTACIITVLVSSAGYVRAEEDEHFGDGKNDHFELDNSDRAILPPTDASRYEFVYKVDLPTGSGTAKCWLTLHYFDHETGYGYLPALSAQMGTTVVCDMGAHLWAENQWYERAEINSAAYQNTTYSDKDTVKSLNTEWIRCEFYWWACDDVGEATFEYVD